MGFALSLLILSLLFEWAASQIGGYRKRCYGTERKAAFILKLFSLRLSSLFASFRCRRFRFLDVTDRDPGHIEGVKKVKYFTMQVIFLQVYRRERKLSFRQQKREFQSKFTRNGTNVK